MMKIISILLFVFAVEARAGLNYSLYYGLATDHYTGNPPEGGYNEDNDVTLLNIAGQRWEGFVGWYYNSYKDDSAIAGTGPRWRWGGLGMAAATGYHFADVVPAPYVYLEKKFFRLMIVGPVINAGIIIEF